MFVFFSTGKIKGKPQILYLYFCYLLIPQTAGHTCKNEYKNKTKLREKNFSSWIFKYWLLKYGIRQLAEK